MSEHTSGSGRAIVVGAGLGGVSAAVALRRAGLDVALYEQADRLESIRLGGGLVVWPNGMRSLQRLGVADAVRASTAEIRRIDFLTDRAKLTSWPVAQVWRDIGAPTVGAARGELHRVLCDGLEPGVLSLGRRCLGFEQHEDGVVARFEDGSEEAGAALVAADGADSSVRAQLMADGEGFPPYAGYSLWHAVIPFADERLEPGTFSLYFGRGTRAATFYVDDEHAYWSGIAYLPPGGRDPQGGHRDAARRLFGGYREPIPTLIDATPEEAIHRQDIYGGIPLERWGSGRVTLLGDAAHPMTTVLGQGACMAMEDGVDLAEALAENGVPAGLRVYEERRMKRTTEMMTLARRLNSTASRENALRCWIRGKAIRFAFGPGIGRRYEALVREGSGAAAR